MFKADNIKIKPTIVWKKLGNEVSILDTQSKEFYILNEISSEIWILANKKNNYEEILSSLKEIYDDKENELRKILDSILRDFKNNSFIL